MSNEDIVAGKLDISVDVVACNFFLLGKKSVEGIFKATTTLLNSHGALIVQTLYPLMACGNQPYRDGWREGSWADFNNTLSDPAP